MSKPTQSIFPLENARLTTDLDCNNLQLVNLDASNLSVGPPGSGNDTGTTMAILKGDGNHGFADAVAGSDYASPGDVALKEDASTHDADILTLTTAVDLTEADIATLTTAVGTKASTAALTAGLALKADDADLQAYITSNDADVALKAYSSDITTALGNKADSASVSAALAGKEPTLPTTANDGYVLVRDISGTWHFVDPVTLGTTSQTFIDGQSFTNTNYDSATAAFVTGDIGKTIVSAGVIPDGTTIVSRTSATRVVLSAPTLSTATGETFTIINRLLTNNTGTVTSVAVTNNATALISTSVTNATSSPTITLTALTNVGANTFYGNFTNFASTAGFGSASVARASLGGTTAGQALFQVTNPSAVSFPQFTVGNAVITRTPAQTLSDIGGESALTFSTPLTRSVGTNVIGIQAAGVGSGSGQSGYLTGSDWVLFNGKPPGTRTITTTAPIRIDGLPSANLTADRTLSMAASSGNPDGTSPVDGYLKGTDFITFTNKVPQSRTILPATGSPLTINNSGQLSANLTIGIPKATALVDGYLASGDFSSFANQVPVIRQSSNAVANVLTLADVTPPITRVILNTLLTAPLTINLPQSVGYGFSIGYPFIEIVDVTVTPALPGGVQTTTNRVTISRTAGINNDLIDGATTIPLPMGAAYTRINSNGLNRWNTAKYFVDSVKDLADSSKQVKLTLHSAFPTATIRNLILPGSDDSVAVVPRTPANSAEFLKSVGADGVVGSDTVKQYQVEPLQFDVLGTSDGTITGDGTITSVRLKTDMTATRLYTWPPANAYSPGEAVRFFDATTAGSVNGTGHIVRVSNATDTFNGALSLDITEPFFNRIFVADPINNVWTVSTFGGTTGSGLTIDNTWHPVAPASGVATITCTPGVVENHHTVTMSGAIQLSMSGATPGVTGQIKFKDSTGNHVVTVPNVTGKTPVTSGTGTFTTSTGTDIVDIYGWNYDGEFFNYYPLGLKMTAALSATYVAPADDLITGLAHSSYLNCGVSAGREYIASKLTANGNASGSVINPGDAYTIGKIGLVMFRIGFPTFNIRCAIFTDNGAGTAPSTTQLAISAPIASNTLSAVTPGQIDFNTNVSLVSGTVFWVVVVSETPPNNSTDYVQWSQHTTASTNTERSPNGSTWANVGTNGRGRFITYKAS